MPKRSEGESPPIRWHEVKEVLGWEISGETVVKLDAGIFRCSCSEYQAGVVSECEHIRQVRMNKPSPKSISVSGFKKGRKLDLA